MFEQSERVLFEHMQPVDEQRLVERVVSISFIAAAPADVRAGVEERVRALPRRRRSRCSCSYMTELYLGFWPAS